MNHFPWRLFRKFYLVLVALSNIIFVITLVIASYIFNFSFFQWPALFVLITFLVLSAVGSLWFAYRFASPIGKIIIKALSIADKKQFRDNFDLADAFQTGSKDYYELDEALSQIRKKLKKRRAQLAHEREESRALMSSIEDAVVTVNIDQNIKFYNSRFADQFLTAEQVQRIFNKEPVTMAEVFKVDEVLENFESTFKTAQGKNFLARLPLAGENYLRHYSVTISPLHEDKTLEVYRALALFHDITEIKKAEQIRIEFVENASHELRTPLTSVKGYLDILKEDIQGGKLDQLDSFVKIISKNVNRLTDLVNDMLELSSLESTADLKLEMLEPDKISQEVIERLSLMAADKNIMIKLKNSAPPFYADQTKVEQVMQNLLTNAIKYIQNGGEVKVLWEETPTHIILRVIDNGPGISEEHVTRLFERFYRVDKGRSRDEGGTGLGLSIVKHIMQSHKGTIAVKSSLGKGCEFICSFPH